VLPLCGSLLKAGSENRFRFADLIEHVGDLPSSWTFCWRNSLGSHSAKVSRSSVTSSCRCFVDKPFGEVWPGLSRVEQNWTNVRYLLDDGPEN